MQGFGQNFQVPSRLLWILLCRLGILASHFCVNYLIFLCYISGLNSSIYYMIRKIFEWLLTKFEQEIFIPQLLHVKSIHGLTDSVGKNNSKCYLILLRVQLLLGYSVSFLKMELEWVRLTS